MTPFEQRDARLSGIAAAGHRPAVQLAAALVFACLLLLSSVLGRPVGVPGVGRDQADAAMLGGGFRSPSPAPAPPAPVFLDIPADRARSINAAVPFAPGPVPAARPYIFAGSAEDRERALICLASAAWYEAGNDALGQQAVVQVVINRLRHPAFPKNVCGVVLQGSERTTGCQFTFTCDGAMARVPAMSQWDAARQVADRALSGFVFKQVGLATHYHTDWVVPYWSGTLDKIAEVRTHLFFRWRGWWGTPAAFRKRYVGGETLHPRLAQLFAGGTGDEPNAEGALVPALAQGDLRAVRVHLTSDAAHEFVLELRSGGQPRDYAAAAFRLCGQKPVCVVSGWRDRQKLPRKLPMPLFKLSSASFLYRRHVELHREQVFWNCRETPMPLPTQCLPGTEPREAKAQEEDNSASQGRSDGSLVPAEQESPREAM